MGIFPTWMSVYHVHAWCSQKLVMLSPQELEPWMVMSPHVSVEKLTQVLWRCSLNHWAICLALVYTLLKNSFLNTMRTFQPRQPFSQLASYSRDPFHHQSRISINSSGIFSPSIPGLVFLVPDPSSHPSFLPSLSLLWECMMQENTFIFMCLCDCVLVHVWRSEVKHGGGPCLLS